LRAGGPFGDRTVGHVMAREPATAVLDTSLREAAELMLSRDQPVLPVLDADGRLAGVVSDGDLLRRAGLPLPLRLFAALTDGERQILLERLPARTLAEAVTAETRTIYVEASVPQAISPLLEWGFEMLPVVGRDGEVVGLFGVEQALRAAASPRADAAGLPGAGGAVRDAEPPTPVGLVMQGAVPAIAATALLSDAMAQLLATPERFLVVVADGRPLGTLSDRLLAQALREPLRSIWLGALRGPESPLAVPAEIAAETTAGLLADRDAPTIDARATQDDAIVAMLEGGHERLLVVDDAGKLVGLVARRGLLRALAQASG
jgi:CBS domain-containing protein